MQASTYGACLRGREHDITCDGSTGSSCFCAACRRSCGHNHPQYLDSHAYRPASMGPIFGAVHGVCESRTGHTVYTRGTSPIAHGLGSRSELPSHLPFLLASARQPRPLVAGRCHRKYLVPKPPLEGHVAREKVSFNDFYFVSTRVPRLPEQQAACTSKHTAGNTTAATNTQRGKCQ